MKFKESSYYLMWNEIGKLRLPTLRGSDGRCLQPFTDYFDSFADEFAEYEEQSAKSAIEPRTYALTSLIEFFAASSKSLEKINDATLNKYKHWARKQARANPRSREHNTQEDTVNIKLRAIYDFIYWCQENFLLPAGTIGPTKCCVESTLPSISYEKNPSEYILKHEKKYPLCFKGTGRKNTSPGTDQHWASEDELEKLEDIFWGSVSAVAFRNTTMLRILDQSAFRIGSATSLTCEQFSDQAFSNQELRANFEVNPRNQKNRRRRPYEISWALARSIRAYIDDEFTGRASIVKHLGGNGTAVASDNIFISTTEGTCLTANFWSTTFGKGFKLIGVRKGAAAHSVRRGASQRRAEQLIEGLLESGLPISEDYITKELMQFLGHGTEEAQASYLRALRRRHSKTQVDKLARALEEQKLETDKFRAQAEAAKIEMAAVTAERDALARANAVLRRAQIRAAKSTLRIGQSRSSRSPVPA